LPSQYSHKSNKKAWWKCSTCDHVWEMMIANRAIGHGCAYCGKKGLHSDGRNSFAIMRPDLAVEWHPTKNGEKSPSGYSVGSSVPIWWQCSSCGNEWKTGMHNRNAGRGCSSCAKFGFDGTKPAIYYSLQIYDDVKIWWFKGGITQNLTKRMQ